MPKRDFSNIGSYRKNQGASGGQYPSREKPPAPASPMIEESLVSVIPLDSILPDPYQSRGGVLPLSLMIPVYNGELSPAEALDQWIATLDESPLYRQRYEALLDLAESIKQYGLVNPIHIYHPPRQVNQYRIESGERRFWAHWLLAREDPAAYTDIRAIIETGFSIYRQVDENEDVSGLSTIGEARNTARLFLMELKVLPPSIGPVDADALYLFYRQVTLPTVELIGQEYLPDGFWTKLTALTKKSRDALNERLNVFRLPREALEVADAASLNMLQLTEILRAERDEVMLELTELAVTHRLTGATLRKLARLSIDNDEAYEQEVAIIRGQAAREKRKQGTALEIHSKRLYQVVRGLDRLNDQEFGAIAERIVAADPKALPAVTANLEKLLAALRERQKKAF